MGTATDFLTEGGTAQLSMHDGVPIAVDLPASLVLAITKCDPGVKGDTRTGALKPATLETGVVVNVPLFVEEGEPDAPRSMESIDRQTVASIC
jgi:elongation factor P